MLAVGRRRQPSKFFYFEKQSSSYPFKFIRKQQSQSRACSFLRGLTEERIG
jgi:hypothetical protein